MDGTALGTVGMVQPGLYLCTEGEELAAPSHVTAAAFEEVEDRRQRSPLI